MVLHAHRSHPLTVSYDRVVSFAGSPSLKEGVDLDGVPAPLGAGESFVVTFETVVV